MISSRDKILNAVYEAVKIPSQLPEKPAGTEKNIRESLEAITPQDYTGLRRQFQTELENVSGEFYAVKNAKQISEIIVPILRKNKYKAVAFPGGGMPEKVVQLVQKNTDIELVDASKLEFAERRDKLAVTPAAIVDAAYAVADVASLAVFYDDTPSVLPYFLPDCIFIIVPAKGLLANQFELFAKIPQEKAENMVLITGPSRTADIEKVLVLGAHGPRRLVVFMFEE